MNFLENITLRKKINPPQQQTNESMEEINSSKFSYDDSNIPDISMSSDTDNIIELRQQLKHLATALQEAQQQIKNLTLENSALTNNIYQLAKQNDIYRKITIDCTPKKIGTSKKVTATPTQIKTPTEPNVSSKQTQTELLPLSDENTLPNKLKNKNTPMNNPPKQKLSPDTEQRKYKNKLCILSSNKFHKTLKIAERLFSEEFQICHYLKHGANINNTVRDLNKKLIDFSKNDLCLIMFGESDFKSTKNYFNIISTLRQDLKDITHTNTIL